jgi:hypothetical protein
LNASKYINSFETKSMIEKKPLTHALRLLNDVYDEGISTLNTRQIPAIK